MIEKIAFARWAVVGGIIAAVGVAGAATKLKRPAAGDACLCTPDAQAPNDLTSALNPEPSSSFASHGAAIPAGSNSTAGPLTAALSGNNVANRPDGGFSSSNANGNGVAWGAGGRFSGARSASSSGGRSATLGGLWRLMNLSHRAQSHGASASVHAARQAAAKKVNPKSRAGTSNPGHGPSTTAPAGAGDLFAEDTTTIPDLLGGGSTPVISAPGGGKPVALAIRDRSRQRPSLDRCFSSAQV